MSTLSVSTHAPLPLGGLIVYGLSGAALGMAAIPIYLNVTRFYSENFGLALATIGLLLLLVRGFDAFIDPLFGTWSDTHCRKGGNRSFFLLLGAPVTALGLLMLYSPATFGITPGLAWLGISLIVVYLGYSCASVSYTAWAAEMSTDSTQRTRAVAWREGFTVLGVLVAVVLPAVLQQKTSAVNAFSQFAWMFVVFALCAAAITAWGAPASQARVDTTTTTSLRKSFTLPLRNPSGRTLFIVFIFNGIAAAIPATLIEFFVRDVVKAIDRLPVFLLSYFVAAVLGLPLWVWLAKRIGQAKVWALSMVLAIAVFFWAAFLSAGDVTAYLFVCILSGVVLGADQAMPAVLLAKVIDRDAENGLGRNEGAYFGLWSLVSKLNLGIAAGVALPLVQVLGYSGASTAAGTTAGTTGTNDGLLALAIVYAIVPCVFKIIAFVLLWRSSFVRGNP
jgi:glycoside/pentoside/hexuronide:cation symporter, GPH family